VRRRGYRCAPPSDRPAAPRAGDRPRYSDARARTTGRHRRFGGSEAVMSPNSARSVGLRWTDEAVRASVRSDVVRRSASIARSIRRWSLDGCTRARKRRADGRSNNRSKNRSMAVRGGMVGGGVYQRVLRCPGGPNPPHIRRIRTVHPAEGPS
jgi:hypothetical protein